MARHGTEHGNDFESLARQYWGAWGEALRGGGKPQAPGWDEAIQWWSQLARSAGAGANGGMDGLGGLSGLAVPGMNASPFGVGAANPAADAIDRFNAQSREWFGRMQQVAARFAGQAAAPADISAAWKQALGGSDGNPFASLFASMQGPGQHDASQWFAQVEPMLAGMRNDAHAWLRLPQFGFAREHQERWQQLADAQLALQEATQAHNTLMGDAGQRAFELFERKLGERSEPGKQIGTARALFDLWIDAAEEAYAEIALSPRFRDSYGALVNAQMRLRAAVQREVEQSSALLGMPTRTELDAAHRKIVQLERELRRLRDAMQGTASTTPVATAAGKTSSAAASAPRKAAAGRAGKARRTAAPATAVAPSATPRAQRVGAKTANRKAAKPAAARVDTAATRQAARKPARSASGAAVGAATRPATAARRTGPRSTVKARTPKAAPSKRTTGKAGKQGGDRPVPARRAVAKRAPAAAVFSASMPSLMPAAPRPLSAPSSKQGAGKPSSGKASSGKPPSGKPSSGKPPKKGGR